MFHSKFIYKHKQNTIVILKKLKESCDIIDNLEGDFPPKCKIHSCSKYEDNWQFLQFLRIVSNTREEQRNKLECKI